MTHVVVIELDRPGVDPPIIHHTKLGTSYHHPLVALMTMKAVDELLKCAIPACRKAGIQIVWLNWGLIEQDIDKMPPTIPN